MNERVKASVLTISSIHFIALIILVGFSVFIYLKANKNTLLYSFLGVQASFLIWILAKILKTVSPIVELRWFFVVFQYFGICALELTFLQFAYYYSRGRSLSKRFLIIAVPFVFLQFIVIATNEYHHLFYTTFDFYGNTFGPAFQLLTRIMYTCIIIGIILIAQKFRKDFYRQRLFYEMLIPIMIPLLTNIFYLSGHYHQLMKYLGWYAFDITPLGFELSLIIFSIAIYKKDFLNIMPIYVDEIIEQVNIGVVIFDHKGQLLDANSIANNLIKEGLTLKEICQSKNNESNLIFLNNQCLEISYKSIMDSKKKVIGNMLTIVDITPYSLLKSNLDEQIRELEEVTKDLEEHVKLNNNLVLVASKNYVARELHDILGHSMTLTIKLLEVALIECLELNCSDSDDNRLKKEVLIEKLQEAHGICVKGYSDLRISLVEKQQMGYDIVSLKTEINKMAKVLKFAGIDFKLGIENTNHVFTESEFLILKRFCQECITNSVKHGKASCIHIHMSFEKDLKQIGIHDNGIGCNALVKGNGLSGLEDRIKSLDGKLTWSSSYLNGFDMVLSYT
jgi:signal transduction histidine kinase